MFDRKAELLLKIYKMKRIVLIFKKKFYVYCGPDGNGNARVQSVLKNVNLTDRIIHENMKIDDEEVDWNTYNKWVEYCNLTE